MCYTSRIQENLLICSFHKLSVMLFRWQAHEYGHFTAVILRKKSITAKNVFEHVENT